MINLTAGIGLSWRILTAIFFVLNLIGCARHSDLRPARLFCENKEEPSGVGASPRFGWTLEAERRGQKQTCYQVLVASRPERLTADQADLWNSGKVESGLSIWIPYGGKRLQPGLTYYWRVRVWDKEKKGTSWSRTARFTTGLFEEKDWSGAKWIAFEDLQDGLRLVPGVHGTGDTLGELAKRRPVVPLFRQEFRVRGKVEQAVVFVCGLGHYELNINGARAGRSFLSPGWTDYRRTRLYNTFDVTAMLKPGQNAVGAIVGNGFHNINRERYRKLVIAYGMPKIILKLRINYCDGTEDVVVTDETWKTHASPVTFTSIYGGEDYDARQEQPGWDLPGFKDRKWKKAIVASGPGGVLRAEADYPLQVMETMDVREIAEPQKDIFVYDFGQNASGIVRLKVKGSRGKQVKLIPGELLDENSLVTQRASGEPYYFLYTLKGEGEEEWTPRFTYYGFRYVQVEGAIPAREASRNGLPRLLSLEFLHTRNSSPEVGQFECSLPLYNEIYDLIRWAVKSNLASVATDCPHREKLGWLEQTHLMGNSIRYLYDIHDLYEKMIRDMMEAQLENGLVPDIAPEYVPFEGGFRDSPEWGSACIILPWYLYLWYGDRQPMKFAYPMMKKYIAYLESRADNDILSHGLGDWYDLGPKFPGESQLTPISLTATAIFYYDLKLMARMAQMLGKGEDASVYAAHAEGVRISFNDRFFNPETKIYATGSQTSFALPLYFGIVDEQFRRDVFKNLENGILAGDKALTAGDVGYRYLLRALDEGGAHQLVYEMNSRSDVPGYGYQVKQGATALTESWPALKFVSNNHMMLGHLMEWFFSGLAGIRQAEDLGGFDPVIIDPHPVGDITWIKSRHRSIRGEIVCNWSIGEGDFTLELAIPVPCRAIVFLPARKKTDVREGARPAPESEGVKFLRMEGSLAVFEVACGKYLFRVVR